MSTKPVKTKPKKQPQPLDDGRSHAPDCSELAKRIPFRMTMHLNCDKAHIGRYTCEKLGIGHEYHHPAKDGYPKHGPGVKVEKWFYREEPKGAPCFPTLRELLEADDELRTRAEATYPPSATPHGHA
jgi:hypothetical protein